MCVILKIFLKIYNILKIIYCKNNNHNQQKNQNKIYKINKKVRKKKVKKKIQEKERAACLQVLMRNPIISNK